MPTKKKARVPDVRSIARGHTVRMMQVLHGIATSEGAATASRVAAAIAIIDRGWGKPKETVDLNHGAQDSLKALLAEIDARPRDVPVIEGAFDVPALEDGRVH